MAIEVRFTDNSADVIRELGTAVDNALFDMGSACEGYAIENSPVRTGRLAGSWGFETYSNRVKIFSKSSAFDKTYYAPYVEYGTSKMAGRHMLRNAVRDHIEEYKRLALKALKGG